MSGLASVLGFGPPCEVRVTLDGEADRLKTKRRGAASVRAAASPQAALAAPLAEPTAENGGSSSATTPGGASMCIYSKGEGVSGSVCVTPRAGKVVEHLGITVQLLGQVELFFDKGNYYDIFRPLTLKLSGGGTIRDATEFKFSFAPGSADLSNESYNGLQVRVRYLVKVNIARNYNMNISHDHPIWVMNVSPAPEINNSIKMEVGIEDCLHIEFEYAKGKYHLEDVVVGKIYFLLVRIRIKHMELEIRRRESTGTGANTYNETETIAKYEVMDGAPVRGECTPIRLFLAPYDLTPTYKNVDNKFSVKYFFNLVLVDEEDRRYFKQQEILLYREHI